MAQLIWSQDVFSKGELSPLMYSRVTVNAYYNSLKLAKNVITIPQGGATKRFGTEYLNEVPGNQTSKDDILFTSFQYLNQCLYLLVFTPDSLTIYLEGTVNATLAGTGLFADDFADMDYSVLDDRFIITTRS